MENGKFDDVDSVKLGKKKLNQTIDLKAKKKTFVRFDSLAAKIGSTGRIGLRNRRQCLSAKLNSIHFQKNSVTTVTTISTFFFAIFWFETSETEWVSRNVGPVDDQWRNGNANGTEFLPSFYRVFGSSLSLSLSISAAGTGGSDFTCRLAPWSLYWFLKKRERERERCDVGARRGVRFGVAAPTPTPQKSKDPLPTPRSSSSKKKLKENRKREREWWKIK